MTQLAISGLAVEFGRTLLFEDVTFTVARGERWGIIGRNGSGKTTLFSLLLGDTQPTRGTIARAPGLRIAVMEQHREFEGATTVWEAASGPFADLLALEQSLAEQATAIGELGDQATPAMFARYDRDLERFQREGGYTYAPRIDAVLHGLGFDPEQARTQPLTTLSGGERGRVGLARQLAAPADVILLDEPTNHLDLETARWLEDYLRNLDATVLLISHDRAFMDQVVDHVLHIEARTAVSYGGGYSDFVTQRGERRLAQQRVFQKQSKFIAAQEDYIRRNIAGQDTSQAKGRRRRLSRLPRLSPPPGEEGTMALRLEAAERGGDQVLVADRVHIAIGERVLLDRFSATVRREEVIGFVGPNGAGKTTLLRAFAGDREPESGEVRIGESIRADYYRQDMAQVPLDQPLFDIIHDLRPTWTRGQVQGHLGRFGFSGDTVLRLAGTMSGGERSRVALAIMMLSRANFLIFDEPTNHLDVESIEALEDAIEDYGGTVILVSHDRALLRALCDRIWVLHDARITDFPGGFAEWETASAERSHAARVAAKEEETIRRVREKQQTRRGEPDDNRKTQQTAFRAARRRLEAVEQRIAALEAEVARLTQTLEDPELYLTPEGGKRATAMGIELETARKRLEKGFTEWTAATEEVERLGA